eukprot:gnl/Chilomastix_cuspidata/1487.p1 GENE.gnl/Chilomastix_cuspidata/1487~~gnl/Chilomastix_cuspidata/1487.p1  ORF type:complete len:1763 (+),score=612.66 gnl/Chilomastix_cuspidata/1487:2616-7904(+)
MPPFILPLPRAASVRLAALSCLFARVNMMLFRTETICFANRRFFLMGIRKFTRWATERYPLCLRSAQKAEACDNLYIDFNAVIHRASHPDTMVPLPRTEKEIVSNILESLYREIMISRPRKRLFIAFDGPAPAAKMVEQSSRRFKGATASGPQGVQLSEAFSSLKRDLGISPNAAPWSSSDLTPGSRKMFVVYFSVVEFLAALKGLQPRHRVPFITDQVVALAGAGAPGLQGSACDPLLQGLTIIISGPSTPGEGEHKVADYIRELQVANPGAAFGGETHVFAGPDSDNVLISLSLHEPRMCISRAHIQFGGIRAIPPSETYCSPAWEAIDYFDIGLLREYIRRDLTWGVRDALRRELLPADDERHLGDDVEKGESDEALGSFLGSLDACGLFPELLTPNLERVIDDYVILITVLGNDFLPTIVGCEIDRDPLEAVFCEYRQELAQTFLRNVRAWAREHLSELSAVSVESPLPDASGLLSTLPDFEYLTCRELDTRSQSVLSPRVLARLYSRILYLERSSFEDMFLQAEKYFTYASAIVDDAAMPKEILPFFPLPLAEYRAEFSADLAALDAAHKRDADAPLGQSANAFHSVASIVFYKNALTETSQSLEQLKGTPALKRVLSQCEELAVEYLRTLEFVAQLYFFPGVPSYGHFYPYKNPPTLYHLTALAEAWQHTPRSPASERYHMEHRFPLPPFQVTMPLQPLAQFICVNKESVVKKRFKYIKSFDAKSAIRSVRPKYESEETPLLAFASGLFRERHCVCESGEQRMMLARRVYSSFARYTASDNFTLKNPSNGILSKLVFPPPPGILDAASVASNFARLPNASGKKPVDVGMLKKLLALEMPYYYHFHPPALHPEGARTWLLDVARNPTSTQRLRFFELYCSLFLPEFVMAPSSAVGNELGSRETYFPCADRNILSRPRFMSFTDLPTLTDGLGDPDQRVLLRFPPELPLTLPIASEALLQDLAGGVTESDDKTPLSYFSEWSAIPENIRSLLLDLIPDASSTQLRTPPMHKDPVLQHMLAYRWRFTQAQPPRVPRALFPAGEFSKLPPKSFTITGANNRFCTLSVATALPSTETFTALPMSDGIPFLLADLGGFPMRPLALLNQKNGMFTQRFKGPAKIPDNYLRALRIIADMYEHTTASRLMKSKDSNSSSFNNLLVICCQATRGALTAPVRAAADAQQGSMFFKYLELQDIVKEKQGQLSIDNKLIHFASLLAEKKITMNVDAKRQLIDYMSGSHVCVCRMNMFNYDRTALKRVKRLLHPAFVCDADLKLDEAILMALGGVHTVTNVLQLTRVTEPFIAPELLGMSGKGKPSDTPVLCHSPYSMAAAFMQKNYAGKILAGSKFCVVKDPSYIAPNSLVLTFQKLAAKLSKSLSLDAYSALFTLKDSAHFLNRWFGLPRRLGTMEFRFTKDVVAFLVGSHEVQMLDRSSKLLTLGFVDYAQGSCMHALYFVRSVHNDLHLTILGVQALQKLFFTLPQLALLATHLTDKKDKSFRFKKKFFHEAQIIDKLLEFDVLYSSDEARPLSATPVQVRALYRASLTSGEFFENLKRFAQLSTHDLRLRFTSNQETEVLPLPLVQVAAEFAVLMAGASVRASLQGARKAKKGGERETFFKTNLFGQFPHGAPAKVSAGSFVVSTSEPSLAAPEMGSVGLVVASLRANRIRYQQSFGHGDVGHAVVWFGAPPFCPSELGGLAFGAPASFLSARCMATLGAAVAAQWRVHSAAELEKFLEAGPAPPEKLLEKVRPALANFLAELRK